MSQSLPRCAALLLVSVLTALSMAVIADVASASRSLEIRGGAGGVRAIARGLTFGDAEAPLARTVICEVTLLRTISRIIPKTPGTLFGRVTGVAVDFPRCSTVGAPFALTAVTPLRDRGSPGTLSGNLYNVSGSPSNLWKLFYDGFSGTLPNVTAINFHIQGFQFLIEYSGVRCLFSGNLFARINIAGRRVTGFMSDLVRNALPQDPTQSFLCPIRNFAVGGQLTVDPALEIALL
jgi:hypothetical protein